MQTLAILHDSLRELKSKSLFWITLAISVLVSIALFGLIGFDESGWHILWFETVESETLHAGSDAARDLMSWLFGGALLWWWLTWGAIIMALIATSSTIPEFTASGEIDVTLAKPVSRAKLYLVKVLGALLFMILQATITVTIAYLLMGLRFGMWFHSAWLAIPLVALQFLYLFAPMAFVGLITRSTLASLLVVLVFWGVVSVIQFGSNQVDRMIVESSTAADRLQARIDESRETIEAEDREATVVEQARIERWENQMRPQRSIQEALEPWQGPINAVELVVPKTGDVQKILANSVDAPTFNELILRLQGFDPEAFAQMTGIQDPEVAEDIQRAGVAGSKAIRATDPVISVGSSLVVTILILGASLIIFQRRDF